MGGSEGVLYLTENHKIQIKYSSRHFSNNKVELATMHSVLELALNRNITSLHIYGDSKMVVDWVNNKIQIKAPHLQQLHRAIRRLLDSFSSLCITNVYKGLNTDADQLSKMALLLVPDQTEIEEVQVGHH